MDLVYLKKLVRIVEQSSVNEIEIEEEGLKIRVAKGRPQDTASAGAAYQSLPQVVHIQPKQEAAAAPPAPAAAPEQKLHEIKSPIVGTFYRAPAPDADAYVEVGQTVQPKQVLCIIEAMKLMNEIECDIPGKIVKILVQNAQPVEYNQTLFLIEPV